MRKKILCAAIFFSAMMLAGCAEKAKERDSVKNNIKVEDTKKSETKEQDSEESISDDKKENKKENKEEDKDKESKEDKETEEIVSDERIIDLESIEAEGKPAYEKYYDEIVTLENAQVFAGEWHRTNVSSSCDAIIAIGNQDEEGFEFEGFFYYYSHMGEINGKAYYLSKNTAIFKCDEYWGEEYVIFQLDGDNLIIRTSDGSAYLGFGMCVFADGEYTHDEPFYTNATILEDTFTSEELDSLKSILGEEIYEENFAWVVRTGVISETDCVLEDGTNGKYYEAFVPTMGGYSFELLMIEDGRWYFLSESGIYNTNVANELDFPAYTFMD